MHIKPKDFPLNINNFISIGNTSFINNLPKNLSEVNYLKTINKYQDDPNLSLEENKKRKEQLARLEEAIRNKKDYSKSAKQKAKDKKRAKIAAKSRNKNRSR